MAQEEALKLETKFEDVPKAESIANWLRGLGFDIEVVNLTNRWDGAKKVRPNTFEIWFGDKDLPPVCSGGFASSEPAGPSQAQPDRP